MDDYSDDLDNREDGGFFDSDVDDEFDRDREYFDEDTDDGEGFNPLATHRIGKDIDELDGFDLDDDVEDELDRLDKEEDDLLEE